MSELIPSTANEWRNQEVEERISEGWNYQIDEIFIDNKEGEKFTRTIASGDAVKILTDVIISDGKDIYMISDLRPENNGDVMFKKFLSTFHFK